MMLMMMLLMMMMMVMMILLLLLMMMMTMMIMMMMIPHQREGNAFPQNRCGSQTGYSFSCSLLMVNAPTVPRLLSSRLSSFFLGGGRYLDGRLQHTWNRKWVSRT